MSDYKKVSKELHELNYILSKFGYRETKSNRDIMELIIDDFKGISSYSPHYHDDLYTYLKSAKATTQLNKLEKK